MIIMKTVPIAFLPDGQCNFRCQNARVMRGL